MPTGEPDPERADRIVDAAVGLVSEVGVQGLTHRAVAAAAGVPLGSTTYHFATRDDLVEAALTRALARWRVDLDAWAEEVVATDDLATAVADWHVTATTTRRDRAIVEYELYVAALRQPALQRLAVEWDHHLETVFCRLVGDQTGGRLVALVASGLTLQSLTQGTPLSRAEIVPLLRAVLASVDAR